MFSSSFSRQVTCLCALVVRSFDVFCHFGPRSAQCVDFSFYPNRGTDEDGSHDQIRHFPTFASAHIDSPASGLPGGPGISQEPAPVSRFPPSKGLLFPSFEAWLGAAPSSIKQFEAFFGLENNRKSFSSSFSFSVLDNPSPLASLSRFAHPTTACTDSPPPPLLLQLMCLSPGVMTTTTTRTGLLAGKRTLLLLCVCPPFQRWTFQPGLITSALAAKKTGFV